MPNNVYTSYGSHAFCGAKDRAKAWFLRNVKNACQQAVPYAIYTNRYRA